MPGSGKTFVSMEMACHVGAGERWRGRRTRRGVVLYVAAESARSYIENRFSALKRERPELAEADVLVIPLALDLLHTAKGDVLKVVETANLVSHGDGEVVRSEMLEVGPPTLGVNAKRIPKIAAARIAELKQPAGTV